MHGGVFVLSPQYLAIIFHVEQVDHLHFIAVLCKLWKFSPLNPAVKYFKWQEVVQAKRRLQGNGLGKVGDLSDKFLSPLQKQMLSNLLSDFRKCDAHQFWSVNRPNDLLQLNRIRADNTITTV